MLSAILRAEKGAFYIELETSESGVAELVTSNGRKRRAFRDPGVALKVVRELGVATGRFALEAWDTRALKVPAWKRPDQSAHMRRRNRLAGDAAGFEADVLRAMAEADRPGTPFVPHDEVMAQLDAKLAATARKAARKGRA